MNKKFKDRKEQRKVTETMNALLAPLMPYLTSDTAAIVERALYLLKEIEIEPQIKENKENKKTEDDWLYETGREEPEILGSGSTYYNVVYTKDENEAMKLSKEAARNYLRRTRTENDVTITQEYSCQVGWIDV